MKRSQPSVWAAVVLGTAALSGHALASNNPLAGALGNLRWGMRDHDVQSALRSELNDKKKLATLEASYVEFDGTPNRWDDTEIADEYTHGNDEAMMTVETDDGTRNYYFFIEGELWKWVKVYPASSAGGRDFGRFSSTIQKRFGKGHSKRGELNAGSGKSYRFVEYMDRNTRVRAVDKLKDQASCMLVFESLDTVRSLSALRANARPGSAAQTAAKDSDEGDATAQKPKREPESDAVASPLGANKSRSIFGNDADEDGAKDEGARKPRAQANARKAQQRSDDRPRPDRQTRSLDRLLGAEDDDPLLGLPE